MRPRAAVLLRYQRANRFAAVRQQRVQTRVVFYGHNAVMILGPSRTRTVRSAFARSVGITAQRPRARKPQPKLMRPKLIVGYGRIVFCEKT